MEPYTLLDEIAVMEHWAERVAASGSRSYVSEQDLDGAVFSVTTSTSDGMHRILDVSAQRSVDGQGPDLAAPTEAELTMLRSVVRAVLDVVGHECGAARTAVALTSWGPRIATLQLGNVSPGTDRYPDETCVPSRGIDAGTVQEGLPSG